MKEDYVSPSLFLTPTGELTFHESLVTRNIHEAYNCTVFLCRSPPRAAGIGERVTISVPVDLHSSFTPVVLCESGADGKNGQNFTRHLLVEKKA